MFEQLEFDTMLNEYCPKAYLRLPPLKPFDNNAALKNKTKKMLVSVETDNKSELITYVNNKETNSCEINQIETLTAWTSLFLARAFSRARLAAS